MWFLRHGLLLYPISKQNISSYCSERLIIFQCMFCKYLELEILQVHNLKRNQGHRPGPLRVYSPLHQSLCCGCLLHLHVRSVHRDCSRKWWCPHHLFTANKVFSLKKGTLSLHSTGLVMVALLGSDFRDCTLSLSKSLSTLSLSHYGFGAAT